MRFTNRFERKEGAVAFFPYRANATAPDREAVDEVCHPKEKREDDILPYRHLNISAYPDPIQSFNSSFFILHYYSASLREGGGPRSGGRSPRVQKQSKRHCSGRIWNPLLRRIAKRREEQAPPLPLSKISALPNLPKTFFSLRRQAKLHAEGASLSACGKHHSPQANFTVQSPRGGCTLCLPPGGRGSAKRWKEPAGMKATICLL